MSIYLGLQNSTPQEIQFLQGIGQEPTAYLEEVGLESGGNIGDQDTIGLLGLINPTSTILSCSANTVNATLTQSRRVANLHTDNLLTHSEYINLMNYSFYSIVSEIKAFGLILDSIFQFTGTSGSSESSFSITNCENWTELDTTTSYISILSNISQLIRGETNKQVLNNTVSTTGFGLNITPCFILSNKKILKWDNTLGRSAIYAPYYWQCLLQYFNFRGGFKESLSVGGNKTNSGWWFNPMFDSTMTIPSYITSQTFNDIFVKNIDFSSSQSNIGVVYGSWQIQKLSDNLIRIDNSQRVLPLIFINNIPGTNEDFSFKIDGVYKFWYQYGMTWNNFTSNDNINKYNIGNHIQISSNNVTYNDASLRGTTATKYKLYIKNSDGTFTLVNKNDLIDGSLNYTTYSS